MKLFLPVCLVLGLLLGGCSTNPALKDAMLGEQSVVPDGKGAIMASVTKSDGEDAWFFYRMKGASEGLRLDAIGYSMLDDFGLGPDDYPEDPKDGRLLLLKAEPGVYELYDWKLYVTSGGGYSYFSPKEFKPLRFTVEEGKITYLGNLHLEALYGRNIVGMRVIAGAEAKNLDEREVDMLLLKSKHPKVSHMPVVVDLPFK